MERDQIIGITIIILSLALLGYLVLWSRRIIDRIAERRLGTIREILRDLSDE